MNQYLQGYPIFGILIPDVVATAGPCTHEEDLEDVVTFLTTARIVLDS